ncbi:MAG: radical SAM protein [Candidatus Buchananbacteria bacterium]
MRIALIFPPSLYQTKETMPPLGLAWLAAVLRNNGFDDIYIIDSVINRYDNKKVVEILKEKGADMIGLSFGTQNRFHAFELAELIKKSFPATPIVAGGPHPTLTAADTLKHIKSIDIIVRGEGELTFLELVKAVVAGEDLADIKGLSYRNSQGEIIHNANRQAIADLDGLPLPARDLLPIDEYRQTIPLSTKICTSIISSRGCPYNCVYCSTAEQWGHNIRYRSAKNVVDEIEFLMDKYKLEGVGFFDDCFTMNKQRVIDICQEIIARQLKVGWWCEARANNIDVELIDWMKRAGCEHIAMAAESGSDEILKNIKKAITVSQVIEAIKIIKGAGIKLKVFFMHGLPGETYKDIKKTVYLSRYLENKLGVDETTQTLTMIYPHTAIELEAKRIGTLPEDFSWAEYYEEKRSYPPLISCAHVPIFEQPGLSYEKIFQFARRAKIEYYLSHPFFSTRKLWKNRKNILKWLTTKTP